METFEEESTTEAIRRWNADNPDDLFARQAPS